MIKCSKRLCYCNRVRSNLKPPISFSSSWHSSSSLLLCLQPLPMTLNLWLRHRLKQYHRTQTLSPQPRRPLRLNLQIILRLNLKIVNPRPKHHRLGQNPITPLLLLGRSFLLPHLPLMNMPNQPNLVLLNPMLRSISSLLHSILGSLVLWSLIASIHRYLLWLSLMHRQHHQFLFL